MVRQSSRLALSLTALAVRVEGHVNPRSPCSQISGNSSGLGHARTPTRRRDAPRADMQITLLPTIFWVI